MLCHNAHSSPLACICHNVEAASMMLQKVLHAWLPGLDHDRLGIPGIMCVQDGHLQRRLMPLPLSNQQP